MKITLRQILFTGVSAIAMVAAGTTTAFAQLATFDVGSDSISGGSGNTTLSGNTVTTSSLGDANGAAMQGSSAGTFTWNFNGNVTANNQYGLQVTTSDGGTNNINVNGATIQGDSTYDGIIFSTESSDHLTNTGSIIGGAGRNGIQIDQSTALTVDNHGSIIGGSGGGQGIVEGAFDQGMGVGGFLTTFNNYSNGTVAGTNGANAIELDNTTTTSTINTAGIITGAIQFGSTTGAGDIVNIYGGAINGAIVGSDNSGNYGTVNFNLIGGTFGTGGTSVNGTFATNGLLGMNGNSLKAVNINSGTVALNNNIYAGSVSVSNGATLLINADALTIHNVGVNTLINNGTLNLQDNYLHANAAISGSGTIKLIVGAGSGGRHGNINLDNQSHL